MANYSCEMDSDLVKGLVEAAVHDVVNSLSSSKYKHVDNMGGYFSDCHIGQYAQFLFFFAKRAFTLNMELADAAPYVNTSLNGIWLNHNVDLPAHFYLDHPLGTIIGKAVIGDYFACCQGCTVCAEDRNGELVFPKLGMHVEMMANSAIIGDCNIGDNVLIAAYALVKNRDIPDNSIVFGIDRDVIIKSYSKEEIQRKLLYF